TAAATGLATQFGDLYRFEATLDTPVSLAAGWVSVFAVDFVDCYFYWANSASGNGAAHTTNGSIGVDFALCLYTEDGIHRADYDTDGEINLSELLRVIQLYNSD